MAVKPKDGIGKGTNVARDAIIELIREWADRHGGEPPRVVDWQGIRGTRWPSYLSAVRHSPDGTWDGMIRAAGYKPRGPGRPSVRGSSRSAIAHYPQDVVSYYRAKKYRASYRAKHQG